MLVTGRAVRPLAREEIGALESAATNAEKLETYMDKRVFDMSLMASADGDHRLADTYRLLAGVLRPRVGLLPNINGPTNRFHVTPARTRETCR